MSTKKIQSCLVLFMVLMRFSNPFDPVDAAEAFYAFGDSFVTTGNGGYMGPPYGMTWPGYPGGRASDGRNQADYFAELFGVPYPTPYSQLQNASESKAGVNFAQGGAGVTYAFGYTPLDTQVDQMEALVQSGALSKLHLRKSVSLVSLGVNDYGSHNAYGTFKESEYATEMKTTVTTVVDGIALNLARLHSLGFRYIIVANLASMSCSPYITVQSKYTSCSRNASLAFETLNHNLLLEQRVKLLNRHLRGAHFVIVNQTKAFEHIFHHGSQYGFEDALTPCCTGINDSYVLNCGHTDSEGRPLYKVCADVAKSVIFDGIHPTQAAWKVVIDLYVSVPGFTALGPPLHSWIKLHHV